MERLTALFGRRLRALRKAKGMTQEQLGRLTHMDYKHIGRLERAEHAPSFDAIEKIVKVLRCEYQDLFGPDRTVTGQAEENLDAVLREIDRMEKPELKRFFSDLLLAIRRLRTR